MKSTKLEVVVGLIYRHFPQPQYLLAQRTERQSFAKLWEFPGGKIEPGETHLCALRRELMEELGINIDTQSCQKKMCIPWNYTENKHNIAINLHIYQVNQYALEAYSAEGQTIRWWARDEITEAILPPANHGLVSAIRLPNSYAISGEFSDLSDFINKIEQVSQAGNSLLQLRLKPLQWQQFSQENTFLQALTRISSQYQSTFLLNSQCAMETQQWQIPQALNGVIKGWHIRSTDLQHPSTLQAIQQHPHYLWGASVHNEKELKASQSIRVDFICLSPILPTSSDSNKKALGFKFAQQLTQLSTVPTYFLGGMNEQHLLSSQQCGAHGIAGISAFWR